MVHAAARQERFEGRSASDFLISDDHAKELKGLALERIRDAASDGRLRTLPGLQFVLWRWSQWTSDSDEAKPWVQSQLYSTHDALWFLQTIINVMTSGSEFIRYVDLSAVSRFCDIDALDSLTSSVDLTALDKTGQRALRAFRYAVQWQREGKPDGYRGESEPGGNPLAEDS